MEAIIDWLSSLQWERLIPEWIGKALGFLSGFVASWFLLFRRRLNAIQKAQSGDSDDIIFQMHVLHPNPSEDTGQRDEEQPNASDSELQPENPGPTKATAKRHASHTLLFRNIAPKTTLNQLYDNIAVREELQKFADQTSLNDPVLDTTGTLGFEILNDALGHIAGLMAITSEPREPWLFAMTCEDRQVVRKRCIRCFLIRPEDLEKFANWTWCQEEVAVEKPWHWFRVIALHRMAILWRSEQQATLRSGQSDERAMPMVDSQTKHDRVRTISVGMNTQEQPIGSPHQIDWTAHLPDLQKLGIELVSQE
ncbi:hypothetical protein FF011L_39370 [Roseimaritima multifibrata]|uniref:Uncharacterized protein n=1 Tax=Roseimaritima multifibrata TaxID=1930274 RepID=A0A517MJX9_9BACT|nr:hypothetical protein [Roseimaritima multifibrata]QDS95150.1 hypothetical protein FF011L_39370 [Roseimaritima multifibrata]